MSRWILALALAALLAFSQAAAAKQVRWSVDEGSSTWTYDVAWKNAAGKTLSATFALPAADVQADLDERVRFRLNEASRASAEAVNDWARGLKGVTLTATARKGGKVDFKATGSDKATVKAALAEAAEVQEEALRDYARQHGWHMDGQRNIRPAHAFHAARYAESVQPIVDALGGPTKDERAFARKALSFVQSIPYEEAPNNRDRFRRPLSLIGKNQGDCDSKVVLYLALMRAAYPKLGLAVISIEGHAFAAVQLEPDKGYAKLKIDGERWTAVEPVGPALHPLGTLSKQSAKAAKKGRFEARKVKRG